ncbi:hypothetical protein ACQRKX_001789 [Enterobacter cloacae]
MQPLMPPVDTPDKLFHDGDPTQGIEGTIVDAEYMNNHQGATQDVQQELINVLAAAAMQPDPTKQNQLITAIQQILGDGISDGALLKENNLSDLVDKPKARASLELKGAATRDVTNSRYDATSGRVSQAGDYGWGVGDGTTMSLASIYDIKCSGVYNALGKGNSSPAEGMPDDSGNTRYAVLAANVYSNLYWVTLISNNEFYVGNVDISAKTALWRRFYNTNYKPTAGDVGALPIAGGRLTGVLEIYNNAPIVQLTEADTGKKYFIVVDGSGFRINEDSTVGNFVLSYVGASKQLKTVGQFVPGDWANFDARYQAKGNYTPAGQAYTKTESDGRYQPKGNYTPAGEAYTKAQSDARYVQGVQLGARALGLSSNESNPKGNAYLPAGCTCVGYTCSNSDANNMKFYYKPIQRNINGTWATIAG